MVPTEDSAGREREGVEVEFAWREGDEERGDDQHAKGGVVFEGIVGVGDGAALLEGWFGGGHGEGGANRALVDCAAEGCLRQIGRREWIEAGLSWSARRRKVKIDVDRRVFHGVWCVVT